MQINHRHAFFGPQHTGTKIPLTLTEIFNFEVQPFVYFLCIFISDVDFRSTRMMPSHFGGLLHSVLTSFSFHKSSNSWCCKERTELSPKSYFVPFVGSR